MNIERLLKDFKNYKINIEGKTSSTVDWYIQKINSFCDDMKISTYEQLISTSADCVQDWLSILADNGNGETTRNNKLSAIKELFKSLRKQRKEKIDIDILDIPNAKAPYKETKYASRDIIMQMLEVITNQRVRAGVAVIMEEGLRFSEMMQITCTGIMRGEQTIVGKGRKERTIYFSPFCINVCREFINGKRKQIVERTGVDTDLLFISDEGTLLTRQSFSASLKLYAEKIGLYWYNEMSPHKLRHGAITNMLNEGVPIQTVRDVAGHSSINTTNRYAHADEEDVKKAMLHIYNKNEDD